MQYQPDSREQFEQTESRASSSQRSTGGPRNNKKGVGRFGPSWLNGLLNGLGFWGVLIVIVLVFAGVLASRFLLMPPWGGFPPARVSVYKVEPTMFEHMYQALGTITAKRTVDLNAEIQGTVTKLYFEEGQFVRAGQVLMQLKADEQRAALVGAQANVASAQEMIASQKATIAQAEQQANAAKSRFQKAQADFKRYEQLYQQELISAQELDQFRTSYETTSADMQALEEQVRQAKFGLKQQQESLASARANQSVRAAQAGYTVIRAPFSGVVGKKYVEKGDYLVYTDKLLTLVDDSELKVTFPVPEIYTQQLEEGMPVKISFDEKTVATATVIFIDPVVSDAGRTITVRALLDSSAKKQFRANQSVSVSLVLATKPNTITVPEETLFAQNKAFFVYRVTKTPPKLPEGAPPLPKDAKYFTKITPVSIGVRQGGVVEILSGLDTDDYVVSGGLQKLQDGAPIVPLFNEK